MMAHLDDAATDATLPPMRMLRFDTPTDLFAQMPQVAEFVQIAPESGEGFSGYFARLRNSATPEDTVVVAAFAMDPHIAIEWAADSVQMLLPEMSAEDMQLMNWVGAWADMPNSENRWATLQRALFATRRSAAVYLALGVGWSGGPLAPNDPVEVPAWRAPRAIGSSVLRGLGQIGLEHKPAALEQIIDRALERLRLH